MMPTTNVQEMMYLPLGIERSSVDFAVKVENDNMKPLLYNGDMVLAKSTHCPKNGELDIFLMNDGLMHLKRCFLSGKRCRLESLDATVPDIIINDCNILNCIGKVVRVVHPEEYRTEEI